jgi:purine-cytosine permease-like protein
MAYLFALFALHDDPHFGIAAVLSYPGASGWNWVLVAGWINVSMAGWFTMIADAADFARYSRSRTDMCLATFSAGTLGMLLSTALGAYGAAATLGKVTNPFVLAADVEQSSLALLALLVFLCVDAWTINVLNLYSAGLSISNMFERLGRFWTTLIAGLFGIALSAVPGMLSYFRYVTVLGDVFSPVAGVLVFDYLFVSRLHIDVSALYDRKSRYRYWFGFNRVAVAWTAIGLVIGSYLIPTSLMPALLTALISGTGYALSMRFITKQTVG